MKLKVFVPDWDGGQINHFCTPLLYPFLQNNLSPQAAMDKYGCWINDIELVQALPDCNIAILKNDVSYYYALNKVQDLLNINRQTARSKKLLLCTTKGDAAITPPLKHFHLYRWSGYASKNKGCQFALPVFIADPVTAYSDGNFWVHTPKTDKPLIGFCGQATGGLLKFGKDIFRNLFYRSLKLAGRRYNDNEPLISSTYVRSQLLDRLESSPLVNTSFLRYKKYRNGVTAREEKETAATTFFQNIFDTQYTLCYRGAGNFSVRLFETMACGRIPVIVMSDNLLPLPDSIDWNRFPVIMPAEKGNIAHIITAFHNKLSEEEFIQLQYYARQAWQQYLTYSGFMHTIIAHYIQITSSAQSHSE